MKNLKKLLFTANLLLIFSFVNAQYLVSATEIASRNTSQVQTILNNAGWETSQMILNSVVSYKITYNTIDVFGAPTVASGALFVPQVECDTLPLVSNHHGTILNKASVPSNNISPEDGLLYSGNGYITTMPDYLGMGENPGIHPYLHSESEATASIDLIRAAREFLNDSLQIFDNNQLFLTGYSQGGHASMAIHKYITTHNLQNEFNIVVSALLSGVYPLYDVQLPMTIDGDSTFYMPVLLPYALASYQLVYGNLYTNFNEYYDPPYDALIAAWLVGSNWGTLPTNLYDFMQDSVLDNIQNNPNHPFNIDIRENDLHNWIPLEPVRMLYCGMDSLAFPENSLITLDTMIALGATDVQALDLDPNADHLGCIIPAHSYALMWFDSLKLECEFFSGLPIDEKQPEISVYPNPIKNIATFSSVKITYFEIYDMMGAMIIKRNSNTIDMSTMNPGIYFAIGFDKHDYPLYKGKIVKK